VKFYFAGSFNRKQELQKYMYKMHEQGHDVTSRWLKTDHEVDISEKEELSPDGQATIFAREDIEDLCEADGVVFFSSADHVAKGRGGRHTEFGYALAIHRPIFLIGRRENAFHALIPERNVFKDFIAFMANIEYVTYGATAYRG